MKNLTEWISNIQNAATQEEAFRQFNEAMCEYGYTNNVYTLMNDHPSIGQKAKHGLATTYPQDWLDFYFARNYQKSDAVWERLLQSPTPFFWAHLIERLSADGTVPGDKLKACLKVIHEAEDAGVADGIGISFVSTLGEIAGMGLSRTKAQREHRYEDMSDIFLLATFFHEKFLGFFQRAEAPTLTAREREVLLWASEDKSDYEISHILNVSSPTVRFHWKKIFEKLEVRGRLPAVLKAIRLQIISPHTIRPPYQRR